MSKKQLKNIPLEPTKIENGRYFFTEGKIYPFPDLLEVQKRSYDNFLKNGIKELLDEVSPISDFTGKKLDLFLIDYKIEDPKYSYQTARRKGLTYESMITSRVRLVNKENGEIKEQEVFLGSIPVMTDKGTFIVNGIERVVVNQLVRSPGIFFSKGDYGRFNIKIVPKRGAWVEIETDKKGILYAKIDRKRKFPVSQLLRIMGFENDESILKEFSLEGIGKESDFISLTLEKDNSKSLGEAYQAVYRKIRPGDLATPENAKHFVEQAFFDFSKYDMGNIARYKINKRFGLKKDESRENRIFQRDEFALIVKELIRLNHEGGEGDDIDHLSNRRIRAVGELVSNKFRVGLLRLERIIKDRMTVIDQEQVAPIQLINARPIIASLKEFFAGSQLSQFMDQTNPLAELAHKRRVSAMGPGGLTRERASFEVRDVHTSHYGRICPIATPEGPNIGLVLHLASYARVNDYGFIETPFRRLENKVKHGKEAIGRILDEEIDGIERKTIITEEILKKIKAKEFKVKPFYTEDVDYFDAEEESYLIIAQANTKFDERGNLAENLIGARKNGKPILVSSSQCTHLDVSPKQIVSEITALIPFLEHDDSTRASMGANMIRQAVPLVYPNSPVIGTGLEKMVGEGTGQAIFARTKGKVIYSDSKKIEIIYEDGEKLDIDLINFDRTNQGTCFNMKSLVRTGQEIKEGDPIYDGASTQKGELAIGQNLLVAYMPWRGYNFEDAIVISDRVITDSVFDSIHITEHILDVRDTKLGAEQITRDIPNVGEYKLRNLDEDGIVRIGAYVNEGDVLVGKVTPKGENRQGPEERLLQAIFGEKAKDVKDTSLRLGGGEGGKVVEVQIFNRTDGDELAVGILRQVKVFIAQTRKLNVGDKMAGRHGNKGVVAKIVPKEDMPFMEDGTPIDIVLNPIGITSRMNIGQLLETHLGWVAREFGIKIASPVLNGIHSEDIQKMMISVGMPEDGKVQLYDGRTGEPFYNKTVVGVKYMLKLSHLVEDKIHARSVGPYSLVTQQPLGGKAQHGGQRFGEMEVWALEGYGAAHTLQEMLTIKSDDVSGRARAYEDIVKGQKLRKPSIPESFSVLVKELQGLCLNVELIDSGEEHHTYIEQDEELLDEIVVNEKDKISEFYEEPEIEINLENEILESSGFSVEGDLDEINDLK